MVIPKAYFQAFDLILRPHRAEQVVTEKIKPGRTAGLIFLDILILSFTPKSIVTRYDAGYYRIHNIKRITQPKKQRRE